MPHQNTTSPRATQQNSATSATPGNDQARDQQRSVRAEPRSYAAPDAEDSTLSPPAAGEMADYADEGDALAMAGGQQGRNHANRPARTEKARGQGRMTLEANRRIVRTGRAD